MSAEKYYVCGSGFRGNVSCIWAADDVFDLALECTFTKIWHDMIESICGKIGSGC